jgi:lipoprotein-anchoring transpeptidase ErfK/SrfK
VVRRTVVRRTVGRRTVAGLAVVGLLVAGVVVLGTGGPHHPARAGAAAPSGRRSADAAAPSGRRSAGAPTVLGGQGERGAAEAGVGGWRSGPARRPPGAPNDAAPVPTTGWIATLHRPTGWSRRPGGPVAGTLTADNPYGTPMVLAVLGAPRRDGWAEVDLPQRPDGSTGWIRWTGVELHRTTYRVAVHLRTHRLVVFDNGRPVSSTPVAVGAAATPTPTGKTYLWELIRPEDPTGPYGPYILGLAMYSKALVTFGGGEAQIAIHGNDDPSSIGRDASNGCIRVPNRVVTDFTTRLPLGTPVAITDT